MAHCGETGLIRRFAGRNLFPVSTYGPDLGL